MTQKGMRNPGFTILQICQIAAGSYVQTSDLLWLC